MIVAGRLIGLVSFGLFTEPLSAVRGFDRETFAFTVRGEDGAGEALRLVCPLH